MLSLSHANQIEGISLYPHHDTGGKSVAAYDNEIFPDFCVRLLERKKSILLSTERFFCNTEKTIRIIFGCLGVMNGFRVLLATYSISSAIFSDSPWYPSLSRAFKPADTDRRMMSCLLKSIFLATSSMSFCICSVKRMGIGFVDGLVCFLCVMKNFYTPRCHKTSFCFTCYIGLYEFWSHGNVIGY